jgi:hypothetical protein
MNGLIHMKILLPNICVFKYFNNIKHQINHDLILELKKLSLEHHSSSISAWDLRFKTKDKNEPDTAKY